MASTNLSYSGSTGVINATAYITEVTTSGKTRKVRLRLAVYAVDYSGGRDGSYSVTCSNSGTDTSSSCVINGSELDIFDETFTVSLNSDNTTANINLSFEAKLYSSSSGWKTITGTITKLTLTEYIPEYTLTISAGAGSSVTVRRTNSPKKGASTGTLSNGSTIYDQDVLQITFAASTGYNMGTHTVNGNSFTSGGSHTVSGSVSVVSTATVKSFTLSISAGTGSTITVNRTSSPKKGAATGALSDGATVYYSDVLKITFEAGAGYEITTHTVNGSAFTSGNTHTVTANVTVIAITNTLGLVYIDNGTTLEAYLIYIDNGSSWEQHIPYIDNGSGWDMCN